MSYALRGGGRDGDQPQDGRSRLLGGHGQVRTLRVAGGGGRLSSGRVLIGSPTASASTVQALLAPDGEALDLVTLTGSYRGKPHPVPQILLLTRVPLSRGGRARVLYRGVTGPDGVVSLSSDASGRYLLLTWRRNGWIDHGRLRPLAAQRGAFTGAWYVTHRHRRLVGDVPAATRRRWECRVR